MITALLQIGVSNALVATVLAVVAFALTRRMRPQWALAVWLFVLAKLLVPPVWTAPIGTLRTLLPATQPRDPIIWSGDQEWIVGANPVHVLPAMDLGTAPIETSESMAPAAEFSLPVAAMLLWGTGTAFWMLLTLYRVRRFDAALRQTRAAPVDLHAEVNSLARRLGLRRSPMVRITRRRVAPLVWALGRKATVLLPADLLGRLSSDERRALLIHELVHLRRRDHLAKLIELVAVALYWWLPAAWWARRNADRATERCCDAEVIAIAPGLSRSYAKALVKTIDFLSDRSQPLPLGASGFSQFGEVSRRIEMILEPATTRHTPWKFRLTAIVVAAAVLPVSVQSLWAEPPVANDEVVAEAEPPTTPESGKTKPSASIAPDIPNDLEKEDEKEQADFNSIVLELEQIANRRQSTVETIKKRRDAATRQLAAVEKAYGTGSVDIDSLLEAQRRLADTEIQYVRAVCAGSDEDAIRQFEKKALLQSARDSLNRARDAWKFVYAKYRTGSRGGEPAIEAKAREQFYQFKCQLKRFESSMEEGEQNEPVGSTERTRVSVLGPICSDDSPNDMEPPTDDEVYRAVMRARFSRGQPTLQADNLSRRIVKEKLAEYVDPPKFFPLVGHAQQHHAHYKCTILTSANRDAREVPTDVVYVDKNHLQLTDEWNLGVTCSLTIGERKLLSQVRDHELQLAREKEELAKLESAYAAAAVVDAKDSSGGKSLLSRQSKEIERLKAQVKKRELELAAARNFLEPRMQQPNGIKFFIGFER